MIYCQNLTTESDLESSTNQENGNGTNKLLKENELRRDSLSLGSVMTAVEFYSVADEILFSYSPNELPKMIFRFLIRQID